MTCLQCTREIEPDSVFCRYCGAPVAASQPSGRRVVRLPDDGKIAGVCAGLADYFGVDVTFIRLAWVLLSIVPGGVVGGLIAYLVAWAVMPPAPGRVTPPAGRQLRRSVSDAKLAGVCGGIAEYLQVDSTIVRLAWAILSIVPGAIVLGVLAYLVAWLIMPRADAPPLQTAPSPL